MKIFFLFAVTILFTNCNTRSTSYSNDLDKIFDSVFKATEPGGSVLIAKDGKIIYEKGFGVEDITTKKAIDNNTLFNVGSISKTFVAFGILQLAKENKLSIDDDIYKYFPDFKDSSIAKKIKIHHLLTHSSGLPDIRNVQSDSVFYLTAKDEENWAPIKKADSLEFQPGERFNYSNPAFNGLALIIEKVTGMKWQDYIISDEEILLGKPVIKDTRISVEHIIGLLAQGWDERQILENYPRLNKESIQAVFAFLLR